MAGGRDFGAGVPYQTEYCLLTGPDGATGCGSRTMAAGSRVPTAARRARTASCASITERHDNEQRLAYLSRFDRLTGEMNRNALTETLAASLDEALKYRGSCGFMLIAVDNLARINEAYGFGVADEVIASVGRRIRSRMRGGDMLGRFSGNKFGVVLNTCTPDDLAMAADRFLGAVREDVVQTAHGPVAATITIGGVAAPRHARTVRRDPRACAGIARYRQGEAARLVRRLPAEHRARRAAQGKRPLDRQDHHRAQRAAHPARLRAGGRRRRRGSPPSTNA